MLYDFVSPQSPGCQCTWAVLLGPLRTVQICGCSIVSVSDEPNMRTFEEEPSLKLFCTSAALIFDLLNILHSFPGLFSRVCLHFWSGRAPVSPTVLGEQAAFGRASGSAEKPRLGQCLGRQGLSSKGVILA